MKYAFIALHRLPFSVWTMCRLLRGHPSGFYAWLRNPLGQRANEDERQIDLLLKVLEESGKVYGYRKLHDDLLDQGGGYIARTGLRVLPALPGSKRRLATNAVPASMAAGLPSLSITLGLPTRLPIKFPQAAIIVPQR